MNISQASLLLTAAILIYHLPLRCISFSYSEIQNLNASCYPKDTCSIPRDLDDSDNHNCDCSSLCLLYNTCCIDSPLLNLTNQYEHRRSASCLSAGQSGESIFMIDFCPSNYEGPAEIRQSCEGDAQDWSDPIANVPATNVANQKIYKTLSCAICNGEHSTNLTMWQITIDCLNLNGNTRLCSKRKNFVINNMVYVPEKNSWGLWSWDSKTDWKFRYLQIGFKMPPSLKKSVKECRPNLISVCDSSWTNTRTRILCQSYMAAVYFSDSAYRNIHCAICNNVTVTNETYMSCHDVTSSNFRSPITLSFGLLLDIDLTDGDKVGRVDSSCDEGQVYDPFSKKCRSIECALPGYTLVNGRCARQSIVPKGG